jgi:hypothetical protein
MKRLFILSASILLIVFLFSCSADVLNIAIEKSNSLNTISNFVSVTGSSSIALSWENPSGKFKEVVLKRKIGAYPYSYTDTGAVTVYQGEGSSYTDSGLTLNETYYYAIWSVTNNNIYSTNPAKTYKKVIDFNSTIRARSIYLVGGSSNYASPFDNLVSQIDAFDPVTDTVYPNVANLPVPRYGCAAASANGNIYVFGGIQTDKSVAKRVDVLKVTSSTWPDNVWTTAADMPLPRFSISAESINNKIYVFGGSSGYLGEYTSPNCLNNVTVQMSLKNHLFDPTTNSWEVDELYIPQMQSRFMNHSSSSYNGIIFYSSGRYNGATALTNNMVVQDLVSNYTLAITTGMPTVGAPASVLFAKKKTSDNSDIILYFIIGGTTTGGITYEPIRVVTSLANLTSTAACYYIQFPNPGATAPAAISMATRPLPSERTYAMASYYGSNVYVFGGIMNGGVVQNTIYKLTVDDSLTFPTGWDTPVSSGFSLRYAFGLTKINN